MIKNLEGAILIEELTSAMSISWVAWFSSIIYESERGIGQQARSHLWFPVYYSRLQCKKYRKGSQFSVLSQIDCQGHRLESQFLIYLFVDFCELGFLYRTLPWQAVQIHFNPNFVILLRFLLVLHWQYFVVSSWRGCKFWSTTTPDGHIPSCSDHRVFLAGEHVKLE